MTKFKLNFFNEKEKPLVSGDRYDEWVKPEFKTHYNSMINKVVSAVKRYHANTRNRNTAKGNFKKK